MVQLNHKVTNVKVWFVDRFHCKPVECTLLYLNEYKISNFVESKISMWQNIAYLNMNKSIS